MDDSKNAGGALLSRGFGIVGAAPTKSRPSVELRGFEPPIADFKSVVLPVTPQPREILAGKSGDDEKSTKRT